MNNPNLDPTQTDIEEPVRAEEAGARISVGSAILASIVFSIAGLLLALLFATWFWVDTMRFVIASALVVAIVTMLIGFGSKGTFQTISAFFISAIILSGSLAWELPEVRENVLQVASGFVPSQTLRAALADANSEVGATACRALLKRGYDEAKGVAPAMAAAPDSSVACLSEEVEGTDSEELLRRDVARLWQDAMMNGRGDEPCRFLIPFAKLAPKVWEDTPARILNLSVSSSSEEIQSCARQEFASLHPSPLKKLRGLGDPREIGAREQEQLFAGMVRDTYGTEQASDGNEVVAGPAMKQWMLSLGCSSLSSSEDPSRPLRLLNMVMASESCGVLTDDDTSPLATWSMTCSEAVDAKTGLATQDDLCASVEFYATGAAIDFAKATVLSGIEIMQWRALNRAVKAGHVQKNALDAASRLTPTEAMNDSLAGAPVTTRWALQPGINATRRFGGDVRSHMQGEKALRGLDRKQMELFKQMAESGKLTGMGEQGRVDIDMKEELEKSGLDYDEVFSKELIEDVNAVDDAELDKESEGSMMDLIGEPEKKSEREKRREKVDVMRDR